MTVVPSPEPQADGPARASSASAVVLIESAVAGVVAAFMTTGSLEVTVIAAIVVLVLIALVLRPSGR